MFYVIKNSKLYEFGDNVTSGWDFPNEALELVGVFESDFYSNRDKFVVSDGRIQDISNSTEYIALQEKLAKQKRAQEILKKLETLDLKCIRALREGGVDTEGVPYLEKYQNEIRALREEYSSLI